MPRKKVGAFLNFKHAELKKNVAFLSFLNPEIAIPWHNSVHPRQRLEI